MRKINSYSKKANYILYIALILILAISGTYLINRNNKNNVSEGLASPKANTEIVENKIIEPEAPLTSNIDDEEFDQNTASILGIQHINGTDKIISLKTTTPGQTLPTSTSLSTTTNTENTYTLSFTDSTGKTTETIEEKDVLQAKLFDKNIIGYQTSGEKAGVYFYDTTTKEKKLITDTQNPQSLQNIALINKEKIFFIQPTTGKTGFKNLNTNEEVILDEKSLSTGSSYTQSSAFRFASLSPNKQYIAFYDLAPQENFYAKVKVYPITAKSKNDIFFETNAFFPPRNLMKHETILEWSPDSRFLVVGNNGKVADLTERRTLFDSEKIESLITKFSPNSKNIINQSLDGKANNIKSILDNKEIALPENISQIEWISDNYTILTIGQQLYLFNTNTAKLETITKEKADFKILNTDTEKGHAWVKKGNETNLVRLKQL